VVFGGNGLLRTLVVALVVATGRRARTPRPG
jgi:hypothetical protein